MKTLKSYVLDEKFRQIGPFGGEQIIYHLYNPSESEAKIRCGDGETADIVVIAPGESLTVTVPRGMRVSAAGAGELRITSGTIGSSGTTATSHGETDVTGTFRKSRPDLWTQNEVIDWGDGSYSIALKKNETISQSHRELVVGNLPADTTSIISADFSAVIGGKTLYPGYFSDNTKLSGIVILDDNVNRASVGISFWMSTAATLRAFITFTRNIEPV
jgi:hypothetical protein